MLYSALHHVNLTYYVTHSEIYFDVSHILPGGRHIKPGTIITAILSKELSDVNIIMRENSLSHKMTILSSENIKSTSQLEITSTSVTSQEITFTSVTSQEITSTAK